MRNLIFAIAIFSLMPCVSYGQLTYKEKEKIIYKIFKDELSNDKRRTKLDKAIEKNPNFGDLYYLRAILIPDFSKSKENWLRGVENGLDLGLSPTLKIYKKIGLLGHNRKGPFVTFCEQYIKLIVENQNGTSNLLMQNTLCLKINEWSKKYNSLDYQADFMVALANFNLYRNCSKEYQINECELQLNKLNNNLSVLKRHKAYSKKNYKKYIDLFDEVDKLRNKILKSNFSEDLDFVLSGNYETTSSHADIIIKKNKLNDYLRVNWGDDTYEFSKTKEDKYKSLTGIKSYGYVNMIFKTDNRFRLLWTKVVSSGPLGEVKKSFYVEYFKKYTEIGCVQGDCNSGFGFYIYDNGDRYEGNWQEGKRNGKGIQNQENGTIYDGDFYNDQYHGKGKITFSGDTFYPSGSSYIGDFANNKLDGYGTFRWKSGDRYIGNFKDGKFNGYGEKISMLDLPYDQGMYKDGELQEEKIRAKKESHGYQLEFKNEINGSYFYDVFLNGVIEDNIHITTSRDSEPGSSILISRFAPPNSWRNFHWFYEARSNSMKNIDYDIRIYDIFSLKEAISKALMDEYSRQ